MRCEVVYADWAFDGFFLVKISPGSPDIQPRISEFGRCAVLLSTVGLRVRSTSDSLDGL